MSKLNDLMNELCPDGVEFKKVKDVYTRIKGTPITATKMKEIETPDGEIRIFAGGKSLKQIGKSQPRNKGHSKQTIFRWLKNLI